MHCVDLGESYSNAYLLATFGFDTAENEPFQVCPLSAYRSGSLLLLLQIPQVFQSKRKEFNAKKKWLPEDAEKAKPSQREQKRVEKELNDLKQKNDFKAKSEAFREQIRYNRMVSNAEKSGQELAALPLPPQARDDRVPCPHCGRKFNADVADRHIPKCATAKARPNRLQRKR